MSTISNDLRKARSALKRYGLLLQSDPKLPNMASIVIGEAIRGSWWAHSRCHDIHAVISRIASDPDVVITKLISGKITYVQRELWPALVAIACSQEPWQRRGISQAARRLLKMVNQRGPLRTDQLQWPRTAKRSPGDAARELERKLLVHGQDTHTERGAHAKYLESWQHWCTSVRVSRATLKPDDGKRIFERIVGDLNNRFGANATLPWSR